MTNSVNLYLASGVSDGVGFWLVNFTEDQDIINSHQSKLLECYRKELFGLEAAIEVKGAINNTLDILAFDSKIDRYKLDKSTWSYSYEIPLSIVEDIFDLWSDNYNNEILWRKYIGLLKFRKKIKNKNNYINLGLKGKVYEFSKRLDELLSYRKVNNSFSIYKSNELMW
tara:strand:+ start:409 stop:915 length:507 start_codon:yes stop_codon:yes gene_type:complete